MKKSLPLSQVYKYLETGPVVLVSTAYKDKNNIMAMSWHTMMEFEPPLIGCVLLNRARSASCISTFILLARAVCGSEYEHRYKGS